jgi:hypothetical protein
MMPDGGMFLPPPGGSPVFVNPRGFTQPQLQAAPQPQQQPRRTALRPRLVRKKPAKTTIIKGYFTGSITVKFPDGSGVRVDPNTGRSFVADATRVRPEDTRRLARNGLTPAVIRSDLTRVNELVRGPAVERVEPLFKVDEALSERNRRAGEARAGHELAEMPQYYRVKLRKETGLGDAECLIDRLNKHPSIEIAYPAYAPQTCRAFDDRAAPDLRDGQGYLDPAPRGLDVRYAWQAGGPAARGLGVRLIDVEHGWILDHEDLPMGIRNVLGGMTYQPGMDNLQHGTAVLGLIAARDGTAGITGIAPLTAIGVSPPPDSINIACAIYNAANHLLPGDVILIEVHLPGPETPPLAAAAGDQTGFVPVEFYPDVYDAVRSATARGIVVVEASGNGGVDLDAYQYRDVVNRFYDSGALMVGAAASDGSPEDFSNYGSRLDVNAWGDSVVTLGYGYDGAGVPDPAYRAGADENDPRFWYTASFSGTSSASAIVAGAVASLQGVARSWRGLSLSPDEVRALLSYTGTPQASSARRVGPRPDLRSAMGYLARAVAASKNGPVSALGYATPGSPFYPMPVTGYPTVERPANDPYLFKLKAVRQALANDAAAERPAGFQPPINPYGLRDYPNTLNNPYEGRR